MIVRSELIPIADLVKREHAPDQTAAAREALEAHLRDNLAALRGFRVFGYADYAAGGSPRLHRAWRRAPRALVDAWAAAHVLGNCEKIRAAVTPLRCAQQHHAGSVHSVCGGCGVGRDNARALTLPFHPFVGASGG